MATVATALNVPGDDWAVSISSDDVSGADDIIAAPSAGAHYLKSIAISSDANITVTVAEGATAGTATNVVIGLVPFPAAGSPVAFYFDPPIKLTDLYSLVLDSSGAGNVHAVAQGFTR